MLAMLFAVSVVAYMVFTHHLKLYIDDHFHEHKFETMTTNLTKAIANGETLFCLFELAGIDHPNQKERRKNDTE